MAYPNSVDTGQIPPFALYSGDIAAAVTGTALTAGAAYLSELIVSAQITIAQMRCWLTGAPTGNVDLGIYDASGANDAPINLLGHTGAILAVTGIFTQNLTSNLILLPGKYWIAYLDTVADTVVCKASQGAGMGVIVRSSATGLTVLPATMGAVLDTSSRVGVMALRSGGFS